MLDDGDGVIQKAKEEGYQAYRICETMSLLSALQQIRKILKATTPRKKKALHRNQAIAGIIPTVVSAPVATCLFALIPHLGMIAILPAVLVLVVGIAASIAVPLAMKHAHMQQQSALLKNANVDGDPNQDVTVDQSPPPSPS